jgi:DNA-binding GntR family transcriptional regulator
MTYMRFLSQVRQTNLRDEVIQQIRTAIIEGRIKPNDHITEAVLTEQLGVSRTPVREALILLEREGLIVSEPNRGSFVRAFTDYDVDELFSMRVTLENMAAEIIIEKNKPLDFDYLYGEIEAQRTAIASNDFKLVRTIDMNFHRYFIEKSNHHLLIRYWTEIVAQVAALLYLRAEAISDYDEYQSIHDHTEIVKAYERRDLPALIHLNRQINARVASECRLGVARLNAR